MCVLVVGHGLRSLQASLRASGLKDPHRFSGTDTPFAFGLGGLTRQAKSGVPQHSLRCRSYRLQDLGRASDSHHSRPSLVGGTLLRVRVLRMKDED